MDGIVMPTSLFGPPTKPNPDVRRAAGRAEPGHGKPPVRRAGRRVLIVEDEAMIAGLIETIELERLDAALLDVRINGHDAFAVADVLMARRIPFIFVSGFTRKQMPPAYRHCAHIAKPFTPDAILALLEEVVGRKSL